MKKIFKRIFFILLTLLLLFAGYFFIGAPPEAKEINWGVNFSQKHAQDLGLDWQETYLALLDDLQVKNIKLITHWDLIEPEKGKYEFENLDWQIKMAEERGTNLILVIGIKTGRWPECHIPRWARDSSKEEQQKEVLELLEQVVLRYRDRFSIWTWQVENEAFFPFGECPWTDTDFLKKEIDLVKSLDGKPITVSDSGEFSFWIRAARLGDIVGATLHRRAWFQELGIYVRYPFTASYYWRRAEIIRKFFNKKVISVELQAEPWGPKLIYDSPLEEQEKTMNLEQFKKNIEFARKTGFDTFYLWGAEWWYWMKKVHNDSKIWDEARNLFSF